MNNPIRLRPAQQKILAYQGGYLGVSAVPGAGKTFTLSLLAARLIADGRIRPDQEVLVVTLTNSAVDNFTARIAAQLQRRGLLAGFGYRVRTLHGLAHDIVREKPSLAGLDERFDIIDERDAYFIRQDIIQNWLKTHPGFFDSWLSPELPPQKADWIRREKLPALLEDIVLAFIRTAKDRRIQPAELAARRNQAPEELPLASFCIDVYAAYQQSLRYRGAVDFDDLIRLSLDVLEQDAAYLERLQERWPYILEDEAQDSSRLQEDLLRLLSARYGNWVRVGDPNQAIYETFTTANPHYLRQFIAQPGVQSLPLPQSGRSQPCIIALANQLVQWTMTGHPAPAARNALFAPPWLEPTPPDDPQPNPPADPASIRLYGQPFTPDEEIRQIIAELKSWLPKNPQATVAILTTTNARGAKFAEALRQAGLPYIELLRSTDQTRRTAGALTHLLRALAQPADPRRIVAAYRVLRRDWREEPQRKELLRTVQQLLAKCPAPEAWLNPYPGSDWLDTLPPETPPEVLAELEAFRQVLRRWQNAALLPVDQLVITLAQEIFTEPSALALAHKLALMLGSIQRNNPAYRLSQLAAELEQIAKNERKFIGFSDDDSGFDPDRYPGQVVVTTVHKAKGLEWDRVYLTSVNSYDYPSLQPDDAYQSEPWFIRNRLNLPAEALAQLQYLLTSPADRQPWREGEATHQARADYVRERLRLLYVGITRARRELIITSNSGSLQGRPVPPALPLQALIRWWQKQECRS